MLTATAVSKQATQRAADFTSVRAAAAQVGMAAGDAAARLHTARAGGHRRLFAAAAGGAVAAAAPAEEPC